VATRIVAMAGAAPRGILEFEEASRTLPVQDAFAVNALAPAELDRAKAVHATHANEWMMQPGVQGVGITSSVDAPGEAALMIYLVRGEKHNAVPAVIDGLRTRVRETSRFTAGRRGQEPEQGCKIPAEKSATFNTLRGENRAGSIQQMLEWPE